MTSEHSDHFVLFKFPYIRAGPVSYTTHGEVARRSGLVLEAIEPLGVYIPIYTKSGGAIRCGYVVWSLLYFSILALLHYRILSSDRIGRFGGLRATIDLNE